jgi:hypothetical protein
VTARTGSRRSGPRSRLTRRLLQTQGDPDLRLDGIQDLYLKISDAADRKLMTELKARQLVNELRDRDIREMTDEQLTKVLEGHARRRGYRNVERIRSNAVRTLVENGQPQEAAEQLVDGLIPAVPELGTDLSLAVQLRHSYDRIEEDLAAGRADLEAALDPEPTTETSGSDPYDRGEN